MNYIKLDPNNLELALIDEEPESGFIIPTIKSREGVFESEFHKLVYLKVLYPYKAEEDKAQGKPPKGIRISRTRSMACCAGSNNVARAH